MTDLHLEAERLKLARTLGCDDARLTGLSGLGVDGYRQLRAACTSALFDGDMASFHRVASVASFLPAAVSAMVAEKAMGPVLSSRVAGLVPPKVAVDLAKRMSLKYNVEVTLLIDPRSAVQMLRLMPVDIVVDVTRELAKRREYITMGRFVDALTDEQIRATMAVMDDETLLRTGFFVESPQRLEEVVALLAPSRLRSIVGEAAREDLQLGGAMLSLLDGVGDQLRARLVEAGMTHDDRRVAEYLVSEARRHGMTELLRGVVPRLSAEPGRRLTKLLEGG